MKREQPNRVGHVGFYQACEVMKKNKQKFLDERPTLPKAAEMIAQMGGPSLGPRTVAEIKKVSGVDWESKKEMGGKVKGRISKVLAVALFRLYRKLGEEVPSDLEAIYKEFSEPKQPQTSTNGNGVHKS